MKLFWELLHHEFNMSIRRKSLWLANGLLIILLMFSVLIPAKNDQPLNFLNTASIWQETAAMVFIYNSLLALVAGMLAADRMQRDFHLGIRELQLSSPINHTVYMLSKFFATLFSLLLPPLLAAILAGGFMVITEQALPLFIPAILVTFLAICVPAYTFVTAASLAFPLIMPLRVYQILFTGYWFWGNYLSNQVFPTISGTYLNASGIYAQQGFFGGTIRQLGIYYTAQQATINICVLILCSLIALLTLNHYLAWQNKNA